MEKFVPCEKCRGRNGPLAQPGYIRMFIDSEDGIHKNEVLVECPCHIKWREESILEYKAKKANLSSFYKNYSPEKDYLGNESREGVNRLMRYCSMYFDDSLPEMTRALIRGAVIYLHGGNGTQKTSIANFMGYEFLRHGKRVYYTVMNTLIKKLQSLNMSDGEMLMELERICDVDLLIIDEAFDKEKVTIYRSNYQIPFLDTFLRERIQEKGRGILFISNVPIDGIEEQGFSHSIQDLIRRTAKGNVIEMRDNYEKISEEIDIKRLF